MDKEITLRIRIPTNRKVAGSVHKLIGCLDDYIQKCVFIMNPSLIICYEQLDQSWTAWYAMS
jgi:hypothetical protein